MPESRLRLLLVQAGLPRPEIQWPVQDPVARTAIWLDLAYPDALLGIEYEGAHHTEADQVLKDAGRYTRLVAQGWRILRYTKHDIAQDRARIVREVRAALGRVLQPSRAFTQSWNCPMWCSLGTSTPPAR